MKAAGRRDQISAISFILGRCWPLTYSQFCCIKDDEIDLNHVVYTVSWLIKRFYQYQTVSETWENIQNKIMRNKPATT